MGLQRVGPNWVTEQQHKLYWGDPSTPFCLSLTEHQPLESPKDVDPSESKRFWGQRKHRAGSLRKVLGQRATKSRKMDKWREEEEEEKKTVTTENKNKFLKVPKWQSTRQPSTQDLWRQPQGQKPRTNLRWESFMCRVELSSGKMSRPKGNAAKDFKQWSLGAMLEFVVKQKAKSAKTPEMESVLPQCLIDSSSYSVQNTENKQRPCYLHPASLIQWTWI